MKSVAIDMGPFRIMVKELAGSNVRHIQQTT